MRNLERRIADICRAVAVEVARRQDGEAGPSTRDRVKEILGPEMYYSEVAERTEVPGVATGLAWTPAGGDILFIEATKMPGKGGMTLTGQLGDVMKESRHGGAQLPAQQGGVARASTRTSSRRRTSTSTSPRAPSPRTAPRRASRSSPRSPRLLTGIRVRSDTAMTGEVTLRGLVLPVGGIKEKVLAAHRAGIKRVILPSAAART